MYPTIGTTRRAGVRSVHWLARRFSTVTPQAQAGRQAVIPPTASDLSSSSMDGDDRDFLREWLIRNLEPVCDADPEVLSKYVLALVQNDPLKPGLQDTCVAKLEEFLGDETAGFVARLFMALADGSYKANASRPNSETPSDEQQSRTSNGYDDDDSRRRERTPSEDEEERRRYNKRRRDDDRSRDGDYKRHQGSPRRDPGGRRQPYPARDMRGGPMGGRGAAPFGMGGDRRRMEWGMPPQGMWPPQHFPPPRGAGYPPDFDPNVYMAENGGMMPPPHMMMPHPMGGRGQFYPPGGRGGRGGRGNFYGGRGAKDGENGEVTVAKTTLHVRHVDPKYVNMTMLSLHFSKFGNVVNVQMRPSAKCAFIQYATEEEAKKAFHSPLPVCNNRFISVKWARHDAQGPEEAPDQSEAASKEASGEDGAPATGDAAEKSADGATAEGESAAVLPEHTMTAEELRAAALEKGRKVLEQKRELLEKQRALKKQKEALIKRQLAQQKELLERMSANSSQFSIAEKRDLLNKITALSAELKALTPRHSAISPTAVTGGENLNGLKAELSALEAEASGGRGGRGGVWSAGRGYLGGRGGRGRGGFVRGSHTLDNRTTIVKVANLPEEARDPIVLTQHFGNFGSVERVVMDEATPGQGFIKFQDRYAGQAALTHGTMFGDKQLEMGWVESQEAPAELTRSDSPTEAAASAGADAGDGTVAAASSDQVSASA
ncbi:hypothetical protein PF002_g6366 [Phytophthora fragariae]|uniref:RRM domain-containing protein n=2 Tax=Phytophthora fragariae TaxID=53985 RepID=A0A6A3UG40_9STRA|nr:hypothetical protein PF011_g10359 [Phytophthora fragariae]KAE9150591.1 hypothetical protein PF006_g5045 [Phytophthora fragariae]KAE9247268.1 hypothetical protein PF002_g6366 [Phytophthora fragariae]KAE9309143.1 hypothetical protein PF001_g10825 [Phytophthora fragariae]